MTGATPSLVRQDRGMKIIVEVEVEGIGVLANPFVAG
jgi:hypothetical protein